MKRTYVMLVALLLAGSAAIAAWKFPPWSAEEPSPHIVASGTVEATEVLVSFRMLGLLNERPVAEGDPVTRGDVVAALDPREAEARLAEAKAALRAARARLAELRGGYRPQEVAQAQAEVRRTAANLANAREEAQRSRVLFEGGALSRERYERDQTASRIAEAQHEAAQERLAMLREGYPKERVSAAEAEVLRTQATVRAAETVLEDMQARSPINGVVTRTHAEAGETVGAGRPIVSVARLHDPWVRVYIPESMIGEVTLGATAYAQVDSFPGRRFAGTVTYVASQAEFTPKNVQTQEERVKLVFAVDVRVENPEGVLKPGMPADVYITRSWRSAR